MRVPRCVASDPTYANPSRASESAHEDYASILKVFKVLKRMKADRTRSKRMEDWDRTIVEHI